MYAIKKNLFIIFLLLFFTSCFYKNSKITVTLRNNLDFDIYVPDTSRLTYTENFNLLTINLNLQEQKKIVNQKNNSVTISEFGNPEIRYTKIKSNSEITLELDLKQINLNKPLALYYFVQDFNYRILYDGYVNVMINDGWITFCDEYMNRNQWNITFENSFKITELAVSDFSSYEKLVIQNGEKYKMMNFEELINKYRNRNNEKNIFNDELFIQNFYSR